MDNKHFNNLEKADRIIELFRNVFYVLTALFMVATFIAGIVYACEYSVGYGLAMLFGGLIIGGIYLFLIYCFSIFAIAIVEMMYDVKNNRLCNETIKDISVSGNKTIGANAFEEVHCYLLYHIERGSYFASVENGDVIKVTKRILVANRFKSEEDAKRFAEYKQLKLEEKWKIIEKDLLIPIE